MRSFQNIAIHLFCRYDHCRIVRNVDMTIELYNNIEKWYDNDVLQSQVTQLSMKNDVVSYHAYSCIELDFITAFYLKQTAKMWTLVVLFLILYIYWFYLVKVKKGPNEAKGPTPLPILSNLYQVLKADKIIFLALHKLSLEYGPVYTLFLGPKKHVVVSGVSELKELMHNPAFDDRSWPPQKRIMDEVYSGQTQKENPSKLRTR